MNTGRVPPLVWHSNTWMVHWVHGVLDQQERPPHTTVTQPTLKQPWVVSTDSSTAYRTQTTTDPHSWGWTELGQTQPKTPHRGVHQLQAVLVAVLTDLLGPQCNITLIYCHNISNEPTDWGQHSADYSHSHSGLECTAQSNRLTTAYRGTHKSSCIS